MSQQINLLPADQDEKGPAILIGAVVGLAILVFTFQWANAASETRELRRQRDAAEQLVQKERAGVVDMQRARAAKGDGATLNAELAALKPRAEAVNQLVAAARAGTLGRSTGYADYAAVLSAVTEEGLWITGVTITKSGTAVTINGHALRNESILKYAQRLNEAFAPFNVRFTSLDMAPESMPPPGSARANSTAVPTIQFKLS